MRREESTTPQSAAAMTAKSSFSLRLIVLALAILSDSGKSKQTNERDDPGGGVSLTSSQLLSPQPNQVDNELTVAATTTSTRWDAFEFAATFRFAHRRNLGPKRTQLGLAHLEKQQPFRC